MQPQVLASLASATLLAAPLAANEPELWTLARAKASVHRFSTTVKAQEIRDLLATDEGLATAVEWCRQTGVTKVYLETFRYDYLVPRPLLERVKARFIGAGFLVSGCVTPTNVGQSSTGWNVVGCYTDRPTQQRLQEIFEYTAGLFDEVMIDDFWFTDCRCAQCDAARQARTITTGSGQYPVPSTSWSDYRCTLLGRLSHERILQPAKRVNPKVQVIIKYPLWYDTYHEQGYDVVRETADFDRTWVGTETRDYHDPVWGGTPQYAGYFLMRWLGGIGGAKCGGAWYDPLRTTAQHYVEQARQTVLGGARESLLHSYGYLYCGHIEPTAVNGPQDIVALRPHLPELLAVAEQVSRRTIVGIAAYKPPSSSPGNEPKVFDFVGMLGLPLVPCHEFPSAAPAVFLSLHALKDTELVPRLTAFLAAGKPVLLTDGLAKALAGKLKLDAPNVQVLPVKGHPKSLLALPQAELDRLRAPLLRAVDATFEAPNQVALYLFSDRSWVIESFADQPVTVRLNGTPVDVPARGWRYWWAG